MGLFASLVFLKVELVGLLQSEMYYTRAACALDDLIGSKEGPHELRMTEEEGTGVDRTSLD